MRIQSRSTPEDVHERLDVTGFILLAPRLVLAVQGLISTATPGHVSTATVCPVAETALITLGHTPPKPFIDLATFTYPSFTSTWLTLTLSSIVFYGGLFLIPLCYLDIHGYTPLGASLPLPLLGVGTYISRSLANRLIGLWGTRTTAYLFIACTLMLTATNGIGHAALAHLII